MPEAQPQALTIDRMTVALEQNNVAAAWMELGRYADACALLDEVVRLEPALTAGHSNRATCLHVLRRLSEALGAYRAAAESDPTFIYPRVQALSVARELCDWRFWEQDVEALRGLSPTAQNTAPQLDLLFIPLSPAQLRQHAECYAASSAPPPVVHRRERQPASKIRIGYVSDELRDHVVGSLLVEVIELHDPATFEVHLFDWGRPSKSVVERRVRRSGIRIHDISKLSDAHAAESIAAAAIDILIDLKGYTTDHRIGIFRRHPAPVQITWLGYPGTLGDASFDYLLADSFVVPPGAEAGYSEKILRLPGVFLPSNRSRPIAAASTRSAQRLPEDAVVYCYLGRSSKITPEVFADWLEIVRSVPGAVLWLRADSEDARQKLVCEALTRDFPSERLVFADDRRMRSSDLIARYTLADIALDSYPYGSHATASEALWACCPIVTRAGDTFASRVAGSMLNALGLESLVTTTREQFRQVAAALGRDRERFTALRLHLQDARLTSSAFDTPLFTRKLELALRTVLLRQQEGLLPKSLTIA